MGGWGRGCMTRPACALVQSGVHVRRAQEWKRARQRQGSKWGRGRGGWGGTQCFIFEGGTLRNWLAIFSDSSFGNKASFFFSFLFLLHPSSSWWFLRPLLPYRWHWRGKHSRILTPRLGCFCKMRHAFPVSGMLCAPRSLLHREQQQDQRRHHCVCCYWLVKAATQVWLPLFWILFRILDSAVGLCRADALSTRTVKGREGRGKGQSCHPTWI